MGDRSRRGFATVLASAMAALLAAVLLAFLGVVRTGQAVSLLRMKGIGADLASASGLEYAGSRLPRDYAGPDVTGALAGGNGGFRWDRRLRAGGSPGPLRIALEIGAVEGKLPVNAGFLDARNRNPGSPGPPVPDHRDLLAHEYHTGLAAAIDGLGAILGIETRRTQGASGLSPDPGDWIRPSWLGQDLLQGRPEGGYRDLAGVDGTLAGLGYTKAERARILPHLSVGPYGTPLESGRTRSNNRDDFPPYAPVSLAVASREVMAALWAHLALPRAQEVFPAAAPGWNAPCSRTGSGPGAVPFANTSLLAVIFPDEALALADRVVAARLAGRLAWRELLRRFVQESDAIFPRDWRDLGQGTAARFWTQMKGELAFTAVTGDPFPHVLPGGGTTWAGWGIDRDLNPANGVQPAHCVPLIGIRRVASPASPSAGWPASPVNRMTPYVSATGPVFLTQGGTLAPATLFEVRSEGIGEPDGRGVRSVRSGVLRAAERLEFTSQEDFGNLAGGGELLRSGIRVLDPDPEGRHDWRPVDPVGGMPARYVDGRVRIQPHVVSLGRWNRRALVPAAAGLADPYRGYLRYPGALGLASREAGRGDAWYYWAFREDFDGRSNASPGGEQGDFWSEIDPSRGLSGNVFRATTGAVDTGNFSNAYLVSYAPGAGPLDDFGTRLECPGIRDGTLKALAAECWMGPFSMWKLIEEVLEADPTNPNGPGRPANRTLLHLACRRSTDQTGTVFEIDYGRDQDPAVRFTVRDGMTPHGRVVWDYHVVLSLDWDPDEDGTFLRLFVNGSGTDWMGAPMEMEYEAPMPAPANRSLKLQVIRCDEMRFYDRVLQPADIPLAYGDRFLRRGTFTSPLYALDAPGVLDGCHWTGLVPPGFPPESLSLEVRGYADPEGLVPAGPPVSCPVPGVPWPLASLGPVRSFDYRVRFDCEAVPGILDDTPIFESVWFTARRQGRSGTWLSLARGD